MLALSVTDAEVELLVIGCVVSLFPLVFGVAVFSPPVVCL